MSLALRPAHSRRHLNVTCYTEGFSHFVTSMTAPVASGWSVRRVGLSPTGKRRLLTAHTRSRRSRPTPWTLGLHKIIIDLRRSEETTMDVGVWLRSLGLGQYEAAFRDNAIDGAVLPKLTLDDLKDLGVAIVGHRRKIISAIEELNAASSARAEGVNAVPTQSHAPVGASSDAAERRPITVMFCDLVGSTSLAARLDAEDWRNLVGSYLDEASQAVTGFGGHVLKGSAMV